MRQTELILFIVVMLINGGIALYKKHKEREAARAARAAESAATSVRADARRPVPARRPALAPMPAVRSAPKQPTRPAPPAMRVPAAPARPATRPAEAPVAVPPIPKVVIEVARTAPATNHSVADRAAHPAHRAPAAATVRRAVDHARPVPLLRLVGGAAGLRQAVLAAEVLGRPRADRPLG